MAQERLDIKQHATDTIVAQVGAGTPPWRKPWTGGRAGASLPMRHSGKAYRGINVLMLWASDETDIRVGGKWRYLWRAINANGQLVDFRLTARRDAKAAKAFLKKAIERARLHRPVSIVTDEAPTYRKVIREINHAYDPYFDSITHIDRKYLNNRIGSDHAALKRLLGHRQIFRSLRSAKATLAGMETIRTIKNGHIESRLPGVRGEIEFMHQLSQITT